MTDPNFAAARLNAVTDALEADAVPARQIYHLRYTDLVVDTMGTLEAMYSHIGIPLSNAGLRGKP